MHDYCNMFLPHLEHPKLATDEKNSFDLWIEHVTKTCIADKEFLEGAGCDKESEFQIKSDELRVKMFKDGKTQYKCTVPTEKAKDRYVTTVKKVIGMKNTFYLLEVESFPVDLYDRMRGRFKASLGPGEKFQCGPSFASPVTHQVTKLRSAQDDVACQIGQQGVCSVVRSAGYITYVTSGYKCVAQAVIDGVSYAIKEGIGINEFKSVWNGIKQGGKALGRIASGLFGK
uniref:Senescence domain-containing protein n=1 Tax=Meloidogyne hapla TaxID=6305 RepID=A0A1I8AXF8_MELHA